MQLIKVFEDKRGSIFSMSGLPLQAEECAILYTKSGYARGACIHDLNSEHLVVLEGIIEYVWGEDHHHRMMKPSDSITVPPKTPHYLISLTDSIVIEWGTTLAEKGGKKDIKMKIIVDEINKQ